MNASVQTGRSPMRHISQPTYRDQVLTIGAFDRHSCVDGRVGLGQDPTIDRSIDCLDPTRHLQVSVDRHRLLPDGGLTEFQRPGDLPVRHPLRHEFKDPLLTS